MPAIALAPHQLRLTIDPATLGFASTAELQDLPLPWVGQERAQAAAQFGLAMQQPDYHLFVLGEVGSGRTSLLRQAMQAEAALRPVPPDLCFLYNFDAPDRPHALRLPAGSGRALRQTLATLAQQLHSDAPLRLGSAQFKSEADRIDGDCQNQDADAFTALENFAADRHFGLSRDNGPLVFTYTGPQDQPLTEAEVRALTPEQRAAIEASEAALRTELTRFQDGARTREQARDQALATLRLNTITPLITQTLQGLRAELGQDPAPPHAARLLPWLDQVERALLGRIDLLEPADPEADSDDEADRKDALDELLGRCSVNLVVDHAGRSSAPVVVEDNPGMRSLFGSVDPGSDAAAPPSAHACVHAGSLLQAHGGFLLLHLHDLAAEEGLWPRLRRFLRSGRVRVDEGSGAGGSGGSALQPEAVEVNVKIVLIGSVDEYYALQEADPDAARRFRAKVDFVERFVATPATQRGTAVYVAHCCRLHGLPHFAASAVAVLLEQSHRDADDQGRQSALFTHTEALAIESAALCRARGATLVEAADMQAALQARMLRHNYPEQELHESLTEGERLITLHGAAGGQINAMTQIDLGDYRFGFPVRITARSFAGQEGLLNIEREVDMSGPIHDKGVLILHSYLTALFSHVAPLALNASIVFEQEYSGVEGDSASCAELYALLSSLSGLPLRQGIAVTGALNQHGEVLPVGGINEKIEGWFLACAATGLDGTQGVLIPARNRRHLMLSRAVQDAVAQGLFSVYTVDHVSDGIALLTDTPSGMAADDAPAPTLDAQSSVDSVLERAEQQLRAFRRACQAAGHTRRGRPGRRAQRD